MGSGKLEMGSWKWVLVFLFFLIPNIYNLTSALAYTERTIGGNLIVTIDPSDPGPKTTVTASVVSYGFDTTSANFVWKLNGAILVQGLGQTKASFRTSDLGKTDTLDIIALTSTGDTVEKILTFTPAQLDLLWEGQTYTPTTYRGLALPSPGSQIRVSALATFVTSGGKTIDPSALVYHWQRDSNNLPLDSGTGKNYLLTQSNNLFSGTKIAVGVATFDGSITAAKEIIVPNFSPKIVFYQDLPLVGPIYQHSLGTGLTLTEDQATVRAAPYYFSLPDYLANKLNYRWLINGRPTTDPAQNTSPVIVVNRNNQSGSYRVDLGIDHPTQVLQTASRSFTIKTQADNLFQPVSQNVFHRLAAALGLIAQTSVNLPADESGANDQAVTAQSTQDAGGGRAGTSLCLTGTDFLSCLPRIVNFMLQAAAILAVLMFAIGGVQYIWGGVDPGSKTEAKKRMWNAVWGLVIALAAYLILTTINPDLVNFKILP